MYNYPIKKAPYKNAKISTSNRGVQFEEMINESNEQYLKRDIAVIYKKPTPVQIVDVNYPSRSKARIDEAYYKTPSTTDYNGIYKGFYIDFDVKQCNSSTSFPLSNIHNHQIEHLKRIDKHGGIGFIMIYFNKLKEIYLITINDLLLFVNRALDGGRKSISIDEIKDKGYLIKESFPIRVPYLEIVNILIEAKK